MTETQDRKLAPEEQAVFDQLAAFFQNLVSSVDLLTKFFEKLEKRVARLEERKE